MKKILLATTLLTMSAGYAAAENTNMTWAGSATAGIAQNGTDKGGVADPNTYGKGDDKMLSYSSATLAVTFAGQTDGGLTFGATLDLTSGVTYALADDDGFDTNGGSFGDPTVYISGSFGKITFSTDNLDGFDGDEISVAAIAAKAAVAATPAVPAVPAVADDPTTPQNEARPAVPGVAAVPGTPAVAAVDAVALDGVYDVQYDGTFGPVSASVIADLDTGLMGVKAAYATGALALSANYAQQDVQEDIYNVSATYSMGLIAITASTDDQSDASLGVTYAGSNGISASATYNTGTGSDDSSVDLTAGYTANGLAVSAEADDVGQANGDMHWTVTASYDLGGGLSVEAGTNYTNDVMVGAAMSF